MLTVAFSHKVSNLDNGECWCVYVREEEFKRAKDVGLCMCVYMLGGDKASV